MDWVDDREKAISSEKAEGYFSIEEGDNRVQLLTHCAPLAQVYDPSTKKYRAAIEGEKPSIKGVCWLLHDGKIKQAKLPYTVVKAIRELQNDADYSFTEFPMPRAINIKAKNAGTKEVEYNVVPSPKETPIPADIMAELKKKPTPEDIIEKIKGKSDEVSPRKHEDGIEYPKDDIDPDDIPF